jgi:hypothetical protein
VTTTSVPSAVSITMFKTLVSKEDGADFLTLNSNKKSKRRTRTQISINSKRRKGVKT